MARFSARCWTNCATCEFWGGPRTLNEPMIAAEVDERARGACRGVWKDATRYALNSCTGWRKWGVLEPLAAPAASAAATP